MRGIAMSGIMGEEVVVGMVLVPLLRVLAHLHDQVSGAEDCWCMLCGLGIPGCHMLGRVAQLEVHTGTNAQRHDQPFILCPGMLQV